MHSRKLRSAVLIVLGALSISAHALAEESIKKVAVPAGRLTIALKTLAEQSGVEFLYSSRRRPFKLSASRRRCSSTPFTAA